MTGLPLAPAGPRHDIGVLDTRAGTITVVPKATFVESGHQDDLRYTWSGDRLLWTRPTASGKGTVVGAYLPATGQAVATTVPIANLAPLAAAG